MIKLIGIFLISSSVALYGNILSKRCKVKIKQREEILLLLEHIKNGVKYGSDTLEVLYKSFDYRDLKRQIELDEAECGKIKPLFEKLGTAKSSSDALALLENAENQLRLFFDKADESDKNKAILYRKLSVIVSITLAIILF